MRIAVCGAGAVGGYLAGRLARAGVAVSALARGAQLDAIRRRGLTVIAGNEEFTVRIPASDDPRELGLQDVVFATVKATSLRLLANRLPALLRPDTMVVFAQNGIPWWYHVELGAAGGGTRLDPDGALRTAVGLDRAVGCVLYTYDEIVSPGVVRNLRPGPYILGEPSGEASGRCAALGALMTAADLDAKTSARIRSEIWNKLFLNFANAAICCLSGCTLREVAGRPELRALSLRLMHEARRVAAAHGVLGLADPEKLLPADMPAHKPSMLKDLEQGREPEFDAIYGAVGDFARAAGVPTPLLDAFLPLLRQRAAIAVGRP